MSFELSKPALFLDRDGVINVEKNYVYQVKDFEFIDGIFDLCLYAKSYGFLIIVITNQAGIGRGYYSEADFEALTRWMLLQFELHKINIDDVYFCPFHPEHGIGVYKKDSLDRKPNPGMILRASREHNLDLSNSVLIGDKLSDIKAGETAGLKNLILFDENDEFKTDFYKINSLYQAKNLLDKFILKK